MEYTLDEKVDQKVCEYLREHHAEYRNTKQKMKELMEQYPNVLAVFETNDAFTLTAEEHGARCQTQETSNKKKKSKMKV